LHPFYENSLERFAQVNQLSRSLVTGVACGAAASGQYQWNNPTQIAQLLTCMMMSGPALTGFTQVCSV